MIRIIIWNLILLATPFVISWMWVAWVRRRNPNAHIRRNYAVLTAIGTMLILISLIIWQYNSGNAPGENYIPPQLKDGQITPGYFE